MNCLNAVKGDPTSAANHVFWVPKGSQPPSVARRVAFSFRWFPSHAKYCKTKWVSCLLCICMSVLIVLFMPRARGRGRRPLYGFRFCIWEVWCLHFCILEDCFAASWHSGGPFWHLGTTLEEHDSGRMDIGSSRAGCSSILESFWDNVYLRNCSKDSNRLLPKIATCRLAKLFHNMFCWAVASGFGLLKLVLFVRMLARSCCFLN